MTVFDGVVPALREALTKHGYTTLTPVQIDVLAPELEGADALVSAQTGSGKTVAFGMALAPTLLQGADRFPRAKVPLALAVAPTRELALQVKRELEWLYEFTGATIASCVGGMDMRDERRQLERGAHIVVGTPGRLRDHIERGSFDTTGLRGVVLDEADEMLDLGFRDDLEYILDSAPSDRRTLMFSATVPKAIATLAKRYQRDAVRIATASESKQHLDIEYRALTVAPNDRDNAIINLLRFFDAKSAIVFCATRATVNHMTARFTNRGFSVVALSGELSQAQRSHALQAMRDGRARVCIATDVAARGIDLPNLELVIHADIPKNREGLLHRSGRTGRAGRKGVSVLIVPHTWRKRTERLLENANIDAIWAKPPSVDDIVKRDRERIFEDTTLTDPLNDDEKAFTNELLARYSAEQIAGAFMRMHSKEQPAAEELIDSGPEQSREHSRDRDRGKGSARDDFKNGVWLSLSVGRKHNAEPRWILPMLCRAGHITKRDIGAIKIHQEETHVELAPGCVDKFLEELGPSRKMEKTISVDRLQGAPHTPRDKSEDKRGPREKSERAPYEKKRKPYQDKNKTSDYVKPAPADKPYVKKETWAAEKPEGEKKSRDDKWEKKAKKFKPGKSADKKGKKSRKERSLAKVENKTGVKPSTKPAAKSGSRPQKPGKLSLSGANPLKRKNKAK